MAINNLSLENFKGSFKGGARTNLFSAQIVNPVNSAGDPDFRFQCKSASLPGSHLNEHEVKFMGRGAFYAGTRNLDPWNVTILNDENFKIRDSLEAWSNAINSISDNTRLFPNGDDSNYKTTGIIYQYGKTGEILRSYKFFGLWVQDLSPIDLSHDNDSIQEYSVTFRYDDYRVDGGVTGSGGQTN